MSAIHDALRRAAETDRRRRTAGPAPVPPPKDSVAPPGGPKPRRAVWGYLLLPVLGAGIWWGTTRPPAESGPTTEPVIATRVLGTSVESPGSEVMIRTPDRTDVDSAKASVDWPDLAASVSIPEPAKEATETTTAAEDPITPTTVREEPGEALAAVTVEVSLAEESETSEPDEVPEEPPDWKLQSIILRNRNSLAMINGQTVVTGEEVGGGLVLEIGRDAVVVGWRGRSYRLELREQ